MAVYWWVWTVPESLRIRRIDAILWQALSRRDHPRPSMRLEAVGRAGVRRHRGCLASTTRSSGPGTSIWARTPPRVPGAQTCGALPGVAVATGYSTLIGRRPPLPLLGRLAHRRRHDQFERATDPLKVTNPATGHPSTGWPTWSPTPTAR
ncbi:hypothetical protein GCM10023170_041100 [Phytohabitans houttuyneae]|uniref:Uncharacterized protein n=1 Tax=Phytohabitans houttuyneae TaxID=1076126 RepID=A0A6V8KK92_9ACTN|nr:hypothetical protein Phou_067690 [Phytohabitans houttuyneae]